MKKILILLGLITSLSGAGQALAASSDQSFSCTLTEDAANAGKFASLGYEIAKFDLRLTGDVASLEVVHPDGSKLLIGDAGQVDAFEDTMFIGWDYNEHWAELKGAGEVIEGMIAVEEDFVFLVACQRIN